MLLGAIGGPEWGPSSPVRPEQGILRLRKELGTYGNLRPCSFASDSLVESSPLKADVCRGTDFVVVRELTGGIYFGARVEDDGSGFAQDTEPYSRAEIERIARLGGHLALARDPPAKVWSLDKANVLATSRLWRKVVTEVMANEFPQLQIGHQLIDSAAMLMVKDPRALNGVVLTSNLFGDIISDEASVIPGSIGLLPSASLGGIPDGKSKCNGIYEPIHGTSAVHRSQETRRDGTLMRIAPRFRTRYLGQGHRQSDRHYPVRRHDAAVLAEPARGGRRRRGSRQGRHRQRLPDKGPRRQRVDPRHGRCHHLRVGEDACILGQQVRSGSCGSGAREEALLRWRRCRGVQDSSCVSFISTESRCRRGLLARHDRSCRESIGLAPCTPQTVTYDVDLNSLGVRKARV